MLATTALTFSAVLAVAGAQPTPGPLDVVAPLIDLKLGLRHCNYMASACPLENGNTDFSFNLVPAVNGASPPSFSLQSVSYPTYHIGIFNYTSGAVGIIAGGDLDDLSWTFVSPVAPPPSGAKDAFSLKSMSKTAWSGFYMYVSTNNFAVCGYKPPAGDMILVDPTVPGNDPLRMSWLVGPLPPANLTTVSIDAAVVTNAAVNPKFMGCHHDYGFAQAPRGFYANLVYGSMFEAGTCSVPSWQTRVSSGANGGSSVAQGSSFSSRPSMQVDLSTAGSVALVNRGIGYAGLSLTGNQPYSIEVWIWTGQDTTAFIELRDFTSDTSLARQDFTVTSTGPDWGSTWIKYNFTLTPSSGTVCTGIPFGSDPSIDCGGDAGPAHICVRCGGEFLVGLSAAGNIKIGYASLMPGAWGLLAGPNGPLPVLKSGAQVLVDLGVTVMRSGGSVSQSMRWKDWRGAQWNRASAQQVWGESLLAGWGPFEVIDMCNALNIEPIITLAYDTNDAMDWADVIEYAWGDATTTTWGRRRAADGHPAVYNVTTFELGNEQYNPDFTAQVAAMEARSKEVGSPALNYMFPQNAGLNAADAQAILDLGVDPSRIIPDLHVGAGGAVEVAESLFNNPPVPGFNISAINAETNAGTHDHTRALAEAADLIDWFTYDTRVTDRLYARTASFCTGSSANFDSWDQGIAFFLPNMTWMQPPGYVHVMIAATWAETSVQATWDKSNTNVMGFAAQKTADGKSLILRVVVGSAVQPLQLNWANGSAAGPTYTLWTLTGTPAQDNTPSNPTAVSPMSQSVPIMAGAPSITTTVPANTFAIMVIQLQ